MKLFFRQLGPQDWDWVLNINAINRCEDTRGIVAVDIDADKPVAACVMDNWTSNSVQAHFMIETPIVLRHGFLEECMDFVFNFADRKKMYGIIPASNEKIVKLTKHMGFTEKTRLEEAYAPGVDYVVMELKKENCKYLPEAKAA
jgi:hypothetical protein